MNSKTKVGIAILAILLIGGSAFGLWYNNQLTESKNKAANSPSRAVSSSSSSSTSNSGTNSSMAKIETIKQGTFNKLDPLHYGSGQVKIINENGQYFVELQDDFATNPDGPDLHVWLVNKQNLGGAVGGVNTTKGTYIDLGTLTKFSGKQRYTINKSEFEMTNYAVVIWCQAFNVQFSNAVLN
jgi:Electron transfer DM13